MHRRTVAAAVVVALAATPLTPAAPAVAATTAALSSSVVLSYIKDANGCVSSGTDFSNSPDTPFGFDGSPATTSWNGSATLTKKSGDTSDQVFLSAAARGTVVGRSVAGRPSSLDVDGTVTTTVTSTRANSACSAFIVGKVRVQGTVDLSAPMLVTIAVESDSGVGVQAAAGPLQVATRSLAGRQSGTVLVQPGQLGDRRRHLPAAPAAAGPAAVDLDRQRAGPHHPDPAGQPDGCRRPARPRRTSCCRPLARARPMP